MTIWTTRVAYARERTMGIVSYCPSGHRIKVKDHLAGKKGVCPTCGATFRIPRVSTPVSAPVRASTSASRETASLPMAAVVSLDSELARTLPPVLPFTIAPTAAPTRTRSQPAAAVPAPIPVPEPEPEGDVEFLPDEELEPAAVPDAIAEAPGASWCVAVPGGEPSEPMAGEAFFEWLVAGGASGGELVWRSDWPEWRAIRQVFPDHVPDLPGNGFPSW
jgi:hypothetical protein